MIPIRAVLVADDHVLVVRPDGSAMRYVAAGHSHPAGWSDEPLATAKRMARAPRRATRERRT